MQSLVLWQRALSHPAALRRSLPALLSLPPLLFITHAAHTTLSPPFSARAGSAHSAARSDTRAPQIHPLSCSGPAPPPSVLQCIHTHTQNAPSFPAFPPQTAPALSVLPQLGSKAAPRPRVHQPSAFHLASAPRVSPALPPMPAHQPCSLLQCRPVLPPCLSVPASTPHPRLSITWGAGPTPFQPISPRPLIFHPSIAFPRLSPSPSPPPSHTLWPRLLVWPHPSPSHARRSAPVFWHPCRTAPTPPPLERPCHPPALHAPTLPPVSSPNLICRTCEHADFCQARRECRGGTRETASTPKQQARGGGGGGGGPRARGGARASRCGRSKLVASPAPLGGL